jgi:cysteine desulfurase
MRSIFLDFSTTTPIAASVRESMLPYLGELYGHPSCNHWIGRAADEAIEDARCHVSTLLNCHPSEVVFTSGGTESVNLALLGVARAISGSMQEKPHLITSLIEHPAVRQTARQLEREGWEVTLVGCTRDGVVRLDELSGAVRPTTRLMSIIHANHQLGTLQPIEQIAELCHRHDILLHSDGAQSVGKIDCNVEDLGVDLLSFSGHKFFAPMGIGGLYIKSGVPIESILYGEGCEAGLRPGTPNVAAIVGLGQAARLAQAGLKGSIDRVQQLRDRMHAQLERLIGRRLRVHGGGVERVPGILSVELPGVTAEALQRKLPEICFGPSIPCNGRTRCPVDSTLVALGLSEQQIANTLRISIGWPTSEDEVQSSVHLIASAYETLTES